MYCNETRQMFGTCRIISKTFRPQDHSENGLIEAQRHFPPIF